MNALGIAASVKRQANIIIRECPFGVYAFGHVSELEAVRSENNIARAVLRIIESAVKFGELNPTKAEQNFFRRWVMEAIGALEESNRDDLAKQLLAYRGRWEGDNPNRIEYFDGYQF